MERESKEKKAADVEFPFPESTETPGTGKSEEGEWVYSNPIVRRPDTDRLDFKGTEAFITLTTADFSQAVKAIRAQLIRERAPTSEGRRACWEFSTFERKSIEGGKQTIRVNLNDVDKDFFRYKKWKKDLQTEANMYFVVVYFFGDRSYARAACPSFEIIGRAKWGKKKRQKLTTAGGKRKPVDQMDHVDTVTDAMGRVEVTPLSLEMEPKDFCDGVEARQGLSLKAWLALLELLVSKLQIEKKTSAIPISMVPQYQHVPTTLDGYSADQTSASHFYGLMRSFAVPKDEKKALTDENLMVTARNLLVVLEFFRPFRPGKYTVGDCIKHMTKNLADNSGRCAWWYHGLISKEEVYRILYDDVLAGKSRPVSRSFCVRFRSTETTMSIVHYRWEQDGPKWKERFIVRSKAGYQLQDPGGDGKFIEVFEKPTVGEIIAELSNPQSRGEKVLVKNVRVMSRFHLEDCGTNKTSYADFPDSVLFDKEDWASTLFA